jgi:hypothetical protein
MLLICGIVYAYRFYTELQKEEDKAVRYCSSYATKRYASSDSLLQFNMKHNRF